MKSKLLIALVLIFNISACDIIKYGIPESNFRLSPESRLPKWVDIPPGYTRDDLTMTITYHVHLDKFFSRAKMVVKSLAPENKVLVEVVGKYRTHPITKEQSRNVYPNYDIIAVNGIEEVFEQREPKDILYVSDDSKVTAVLKKE